MKVYCVVDGVAVGARDVGTSTAAMLKQLDAKKLVAVYDPSVDPMREKDTREAIAEGDVVAVST